MKLVQVTRVVWSLPAVVVAAVVVVAAFSVDFAVAQADCPDGGVKYKGACVTPAEKCAARGWEVRGDGRFCAVNFVRATNGIPGNVCAFGRGGLRCETIFGPNLEFPRRPADGDDPAYVFDCDRFRDRGLSPATENLGAVAERRDCVCADPRAKRVGEKAVVVNGRTFHFGGECECPAGEERGEDGLCSGAPAPSWPCPNRMAEMDGECVAPQEKCEARGWEVIGDGRFCAINYVRATSGIPGNACAFHRGGLPCDVVFGANLDFPPRPADGASPTYVFDCDRFGRRGLRPSRHNTAEAPNRLNCECATPGAVRFDGETTEVNGQPFLFAGYCE